MSPGSRRREKNRARSPVAVRGRDGSLDRAEQEADKQVLRCFCAKLLINAFYLNCTAVCRRPPARRTSC